MNFLLEDILHLFPGLPTGLEKGLSSIHVFFGCSNQLSPNKFLDSSIPSLEKLCNGGEKGKKKKDKREK